MLHGICLRGLSSVVPSKIVTNSDLEKILDTSDEWISERTGIRKRHICTEDENILTLSVQVAQKAIKTINPLDIDMIIVATSTSDYLYPSVACRVQAEIGASRAVCFDMSAACTGFIYAMSTAISYIGSGMAQNILVIGTDVHSRYIDWTDRNTAILFGDGAGAILLGRTDVAQSQFINLHLESDGSGGCELTLPVPGTQYPQGAIEQVVGTTQMNGRKIYQFAVQNVPRIIQKVCELSEISPSSISHLLAHQANQRILNAIADRLDWDNSKCLSNIAKYGNTSAASIPLIWDESRDALQEGDTLCLAGFGAGLTLGALLWRWDTSYLID